MLRQTITLGAAAALTGCVAPATDRRVTGRRADLIRAENARPGTRDWLLTQTRVDPQTKYRCPWIEGYCSRTSVRAGEEITFHVSTNPPSPFTLEIYRMGYYGGDGARLMKTYEPLPGQTQPDPPLGPNRVRECQWSPCARLKIPRDWLSGVYLGKLRALHDGCQSYVIFIVRDDRRADFIFQCSDTTWQAYNRWPSQFSLYDDGDQQWYWGNNVAVGFDRPYGKYCQIMDAPLSTGSGEWFLWEFPFAFWLESQGYDVTYISNLDTHADPRGLGRAKGFLSVGHDEYYSLEMFRQLQAAIAGGLNVAFFSGNTCCGRIAFEPNSRGVRQRIFSRQDFFGPHDQADIQRLPSMGLLPHASPSSAELVGARNIAPFTGGADWICAAPEHWLFAHTGMKKGDGIPGLVGWEWHGDPARIPGLEIVATGPTQEAPGKPNGGIYTATLYPGPKGNFVFNASTCWWGDGLSAPPGYVRPIVYTEPKGVDPRVQQITRNVLERMRGGRGEGQGLKAKERKYTSTQTTAAVRAQLGYLGIWILRGNFAGTDRHFQTHGRAVAGCRRVGEGLRSAPVNANLLRFLPALALAAVFAGCQPNPDARPNSVSGTIETDEVRVASRYGGRVERILAQEGEGLRAGQWLVELDAAELPARRAQVAAQLAEAEAGPRPQAIAAAKADWEAQVAQHELARLERKRADELFAARTVSETERDRAAAHEQALEKGVAAARSRYDLLLAGTRPERLALAKAQLAELDTQLGELKISAPTNCVLEALAVKVGDVLAPNQPVATLLLTNHLWVRVFAPEPWLGHIQVGDAVKARVDSFPGKDFAGVIEQIARSAEFMPRNVQTVGERVKQVFGVKVRLAPAAGQLRAGMAADVTFSEVAK